MFKEQAELLIKECEEELNSQYERLDKIALNNQEKVLDAFRENAIQARHMFGTTGYGYDDTGRDGLSNMYKTIFKAEDAIVSPNIGLYILLSPSRPVSS